MNENKLRGFGHIKNPTKITKIRTHKKIGSYGITLLVKVQLTQDCLSVYSHVAKITKTTKSIQYCCVEMKLSSELITFTERNKRNCQQPHQKRERNWRYRESRVSIFLLMAPLQRIHKHFHSWIKQLYKPTNGLTPYLCMKKC